MAVPVRTGAFQPVTAYDAPEILLTQLLDKELSFQSFKNTITSGYGGDEYLSPLERDNITEGIKDAIGRSKVSDALVNVATNPWVWLGFVLGPGGYAGTRAAGKVFVDFAKRSWWHPAAETLNGVFQNTAMTAAARQMVKGRELQARVFHTTIQPAEEALAKKLGITVQQFRTPERILDDAIRQEVTDLHNVIYLSLDGADQVRSAGALEAVERFKINRRVGGEFQEVLSLNPETKEGLETIMELNDVFKATTTRAGGARIPLMKLPEPLRKKLFPQFVEPIQPDLPPGLIDELDDLVVTTGLPEERIFVPKDFKELDNLTEIGIVERSLRNHRVGEEVWNYRTAVNQAFKDRFLAMYAKDGVTSDQITQALRNAPKDVKSRADAMEEFLDISKMRRLNRAHLDEVNDLNVSRDHGSYIEELYSLSTRRGFLTEDALNNNLRVGIKTDEKFERTLLEGFVAKLDLDNYMPRNGAKFQSALRQGDGTFTLEPGEFSPISRIDKTAESYRAMQKAREAGAKASGRSISRRRDLALYAPEDLRSLNDSLVRVTGKGFNRKFYFDQLEDFDKVARMANKDGHLVVTNNTNLQNGILAYERQTGRDLAFYIQQPGEEVRMMQRTLIPTYKKLLGGTPAELDTSRPFTSGAKRKPNLLTEMRPDPMGIGPKQLAPEGGWSMGDVFDQSIEMIGLEARGEVKALAGTARGARQSAKILDRARLYQEYARDYGIPAILGTQTPKANKLVGLATKTAQVGANAILRSPLGDALEANTPNFVKQLDYFSRTPVDTLASRATFEASGYLYSTHLGLNMGSVLLNLQQPYLHLAGQLGFRRTMNAQMEAIGELNNYAKLRYNKFGTKPIGPDQRRELIEEAFEFPEETLLVGDLLESVDQVVVAGHAAGGGPASGLRRFTIEYPMKLFEKGEWLNRLTTVKAMKANYIDQGLPVRDAAGNVTERFSIDARRMVQETQFGADPFNTPLLFMTNQKGVGPLGSWFSDPLTRQFLTFSLRTPLALRTIGERVGKLNPETMRTYRTFAGGMKIPGTENLFGKMMVDGIRLMAISAALKEVAQPFGLDLTRGGFTAAMGEIFGGERITQSPPGTIPVRIPPVYSIPMDIFLNGALMGDMQLASGALLRAGVPGAIGLQRALGFTQKLPGPLGLVQKTYADYKNLTADGLVPIYKHDGTLIDFRKPIDLAMSAAGLNMRSHKHASNIDYYFSKQRDVMSQMKRQIRNALILENDIPKAHRLEAEYLKKFGIPVAFSKQQIKAGLQATEVARSERVLERVPTEMRPFYQRMLADEAQRLGLTPQQLLQGATVAQRDRMGSRFDREISPEAQAELDRLLAARESTIERAKSMAFAGYEGF